MESATLDRAESAPLPSDNPKLPPGPAATQQRPSLPAGPTNGGGDHRGHARRRHQPRRTQATRRDRGAVARRTIDNTEMIHAVHERPTPRVPPPLASDLREPRHQRALLPRRVRRLGRLGRREPGPVSEASRTGRSRCRQRDRELEALEAPMRSSPAAAETPVPVAVRSLLSSMARSPTGVSDRLLRPRDVA